MGIRIAVLGLGTFGREVALELARLGHDVLALDRRQEPVQAVKDYVSQAVVADAADRSVLEDLGLKGLDSAVVSLGDNMAGSILLTLYLKELEVKHIVVKASNDDHSLVLQKVGADQIIIPEREMARRLAHTLTSPNLIDYLPVGPDTAIVEMAPPEAFVGQSPRQMDLRKKLGIQILAIKDEERQEVRVVIDPDYLIQKGDVLVVLGRPEDIDKLRKVS